jgi:ketosteroid isomerase-like protein
MYKAAVRWQVRRGLQTLNAGDPDRQVGGYALDATLVFPGVSSWSGRYEGRDAIAGFLAFFTEHGLQLEAEDILVNGPPWRTRVAITATVTAPGADGATVYRNRAAMYARARWGKITYQEDYEDTHESQRFDQHLHRTDGDTVIRPAPAAP